MILFLVVGFVEVLLIEGRVFEEGRFGGDRIKSLVLDIVFFEI